MHRQSLRRGEIRLGGLQFSCLLSKVGKQKTSLKERCWTNNVRGAIIDSGSVGQFWPVKCRKCRMTFSVFVQVATCHKVSSQVLEKLYCRLVKILEVGGLAVKKEIALGMKAIVCVPSKRILAEWIFIRIVITSRHKVLKANSSL